MTAIEVSKAHEPVDVLAERLNDPAVAASLVTLLDHADLLSTVVLGLSGFLERGDTVTDSIAAGVQELRAAAADEGGKLDLPSAKEVTTLMRVAARSTPVVVDLLDSPIVSPEMVALLSLISEAAVEGAAKARASGDSVSGIRQTLKALRDPEVARGLDLLVEIAKALGRRMGAAST